MNFLIKLLVNTLALVAVVHIIPGIHISNWATAVWAVAGLGIVNAVIKPIVLLLTLPLNILSLGLFTFVINALLFYFVSTFIPGFTISGFGAALAGSLVYSVLSSVLSIIVTPQAHIRIHSHHSRSEEHPRYRDAIDVEGKRTDEI